ncbi:MAG: hypothetical protein COB16_00685 [Rhodobacteraceae bacterium]|nr:MAG: hypothetical protein COB16_00685 [Paracoccaceae bacterium]
MVDKYCFDGSFTINFDLIRILEPMHMIVRSLLPALAFLILPLHLANAEVAVDADTSSHTEEQKVRVPDQIGSSGSMRYSVPFDIPSFRGLEPNLGLSYNSTFKGKGRAETWLGVGWQLTGFSSIERVSVGGGTPSYDDNYDVFRLDGMELMICRDSQAIAPLPTSRSYPERYETDTASASCLAGGNMSTMVESHRKIEMKYQTIGGEQVEYFEVTNTKGVRYTYRSIGSICSDASSGTVCEHASSTSVDEKNVFFRRKFLLAEIQDAQTTPNIVTFYYHFSGKAEAHAHRPRAIKYGNGYKVSFGYDALASPMSTYAVGSGAHFGEQRFRLRSVFVHDGSAKIRAYALEYQTSAATDASLLTSVTPYGSDFTLNSQDGNLIDGGSQLPSLIKDITYSSDRYELESLNLGLEFNDDFEWTYVLDGNADGISDIIELPSKTRSQTGQNCSSDGCEPIYTTVDRPGQNHLGNTDRTIGTGPTENLPYAYDNTTVPQQGWMGIVSHGLVEGAKDLSHWYTLFEKCYRTIVTESNGDGHTSWFEDDCYHGATNIFTGDVSLENSVLTSPSPGVYPNMLVGNFDRDLRSEITWGGAAPSEIDENGSLMLDPSLGAMPNYSSNPSLFGAPKVADIDGDGIDEVLTATAYNKNVDGQFVSFSYSSSINLTSHPKCHSDQTCSLIFGDVNGDGADDAVIVARHWGGSIKAEVALSHGKGFGPWQDIWDEDFDLEAEWYAGYLYGSYNDWRYASGPVIHSIADVNGDGLTRRRMARFAFPKPPAAPKPGAGAD